MHITTLDEFFIGTFTTIINFGHVSLPVTVVAWAGPSRKNPDVTLDSVVTKDGTDITREISDEIDNTLCAEAESLFKSEWRDEEDRAEDDRVMALEVDQFERAAYGMAD